MRCKKILKCKEAVNQKVTSIFFLKANIRSKKRGLYIKSPFILQMLVNSSFVMLFNLLLTQIINDCKT